MGRVVAELVALSCTKADAVSDIPSCSEVRARNQMMSIQSLSGRCHPALLTDVIEPYYLAPKGVHPIFLYGTEFLSRLLSLLLTLNTSSLNGFRGAFQGGLSFESTHFITFVIVALPRLFLYFIHSGQSTISHRRLSLPSFWYTPQTEIA